MTAASFEPFELSEPEQRIVACYEQLEAVLLEHREDLPPFAERNAVKALAALWQVVNGAGLQPGQIYETGA